jgi:hypothetical protein
LLDAEKIPVETVRGDTLMLFRVACAWIRNCIGRRVGVPGVGVGVGVGVGIGVAFASMYLQQAVLFVGVVFRLDWVYFVKNWFE